jgi:hypothetical protein
LIRDALAEMKYYEGVTGKKEFDEVLSNRTPATLAILKDAQFRFYSQSEIFSDETSF